MAFGTYTSPDLRGRWIGLLDTIGLADSWQSGLTNIAGAGSNRMLVFFASNEEQATSSPMPTGVKYGGQPLTSVLVKEVNSGCCETGPAIR